MRSGRDTWSVTQDIIAEATAPTSLVVWRNAAISVGVSAPARPAPSASTTTARQAYLRNLPTIMHYDGGP